MGGRKKPHDVLGSVVEDRVAACGCLALAFSEHVLTELEHEGETQRRK